MRIGVIGLQGAVSEHIEITKSSMEKLGISGDVVLVGKPEDLENVDGIIIPGGESTTISKLMKKFGIFERVQKLGREGLPILGTCAGMIILAKRGDEQVERTKQPLLKLMDIEIVRNAFGRQRESFEAEIEIPTLGRRNISGVFIRSPAVKRIWGDAKVMAEFNGKIVAVKQNNMIGVAFHPELTADTRLHEYFLKTCRERKRSR